MIYADNAATYASVKLDGLPCRAEPVNTAKQVYRLRKGEVIKILYKGEGQKPMAGKTALEGDWYRILTDDGTMDLSEHLSWLLLSLGEAQRCCP